MSVDTPTPATLDAPPITQWRQRLNQGREEIKRHFLDGGTVHMAMVKQSQLTDAVLIDVWRVAQPPQSAALIAVGGYGRGLMAPYSDVDILVLCEDEGGDANAPSIEQFIGMLWDIGIDLGHSVRTIEQCLEQARQDVTIQTNLLEARWLAGNEALFARFREAYVATLDPREFCEAKLLEQQQRHARFNDVAYSLEPNIKENPGGLRDLQVIQWTIRASNLGSTWREMTEHRIITSEEATRLARHERTLLALRARLHFLAGRREDRLLFDLQTQLAHSLGMSDTAARRASEQLMQRFYRTAKAVLQLNAIVLANLRKRIFPAPDSNPEVLNARFQVRNAFLEMRRSDVFERQPRAIFEIFSLWQQHPEVKGLGAGTLRALWHARKYVNAEFRDDPHNRDAFMAMLRQPAGITHTLRRLNQYGILGHYIPAFGRIVGRMQHDLFHVYTVDAHILMVVRNLRRFAIPEMAHEYPLCSRLMSEFAHPELLYLAGLFHDIAKGRGGDHSQLGKVDALKFCKLHDIPDEQAKLVAWLVEHHLTLSATAQKQDLSDPAVIHAFADLVKTDRRLVALYILTVADIRGTSPKVWNAWKAKLLEDLFWATRRVLGGDVTAIEGTLQERREQAQAKLRAYAMEPGIEQALWKHLTDSYFMRNDPGEIAWHTRVLATRVETEQPIVKARLSPVGEGLQVLIYVEDQPNLFARICGFFERINYNIVEAKIYTTRHNYALDTFQVMDPTNSKSHYRDLISYVEHELRERIRAQVPLEPVTTARLPRQLRAFPFTPEVVIRPDEKGKYHYLSLIAGDRPGLLSRVARTLAGYNIDVHNAKINTLGGRAEDVFLIQGDALNNQKSVIRLEADLIHQLES